MNTKAAAKEKILYQENYKKGACRVRADLLPDRLPYMSDDVECITAIEVRACGNVLVGGEELEFQDVRVYTRMKP